MPNEVVICGETIYTTVTIWVVIFEGFRVMERLFAIEDVSMVLKVSSRS